MTTPNNFAQLGLSQAVLSTLNELDYQTPTPIQAQAIPAILDGQDILGVAQTGTGKTAAFSLPILSKLNSSEKYPQVLVLTPTRELAIQVAKAFSNYANNCNGLNTVAIYGGTDYVPQIKALKRGTQIIVGTPGRIIDHIKKGTLKLGKLSHLVLDEADEMLQMGFIDDVKLILNHTPEQRQICLFSATMPKEVRQLVKTYLHSPKEIIIKQKTMTASTIKQQYWLVNHAHKFDALTRILEITTFDAMLIFLRTKSGTVEVADKLIANGYRAAALNGDLAQNHRERIIEQLKNQKIDILIATDVAARGLDIPRISHVVNYDIPQDSESYVHRVGRTGRAGRIGNAILFVSPKEQRRLHAIEKMTKQRIEIMEMPSTAVINQHRIAKFKASIVEQLTHNTSDLFEGIIKDIAEEEQASGIQIATILAKLYQGNKPLLLEDKPLKASKGSQRSKPKENMVRYRLEVGKNDGAKAKHIIGAIANESGLDGQVIQNLSIEDNFSFIDLPKEIPKHIFQQLKHTWVCQKPLNITHLKERSKKFKPKRRQYKQKHK